MQNEFGKNVVQGIVRYSQVWEDHAILSEGLAIGPDDHVLCIASAGCNALALLLAGAARVTAIDLNPAQAALVELKLAAYKRFEEHADFARLLGALPGDRLALYDRVRPGLPASAQAFWDANTADLQSGVIHTGRFDRYLDAFHKSGAIDAGAAADLLAAEGEAAQTAAFERVTTAQMRGAFQKYFSRESMAKLGRDPAQFKYVPDGDITAALWERFRHVATQLPTRGNFYLEYLFTSTYADLAAGPPYLAPQNYAKLRALAPRMNVVVASLEELLADRSQRFDKAGLSDVFEYMSPEATEGLMTALADGLSPGGRIAYWNLLIPRQSPDSLRARLAPLPELSHQLWLRDRAPFYSAFRVEEVK
jgi:S-adenosylmethionine-diacylglycerol 3-amino-3-carboxypropyl transferase